MREFDLFVIGTGAANLVSDAAIDAGLRVGICEKYKFGGTCLTRGCIPTKILATAAEKLISLRSYEKLGISLPSDQIRLDQGKMKDRVFAKIDESLEIAEEYRDAGATVYEGTARFVSDEEVEILLHTGKKERVRAERILVATGAKTRLPDLPGLHEVGFLCSENFFAEAYPFPFPSSVVILGGGYIGCEFASIFAAFGSAVTIVQSAPRLLRIMDEELSAALEAEMTERGIRIYKNARAEALREEQGMKCLSFCQGEERHEILAEEIFIATGVEPNSAELGLENTSLLLDARGYIRTNEAMETSLPHIYCLGDANGKIQLRHKANREAEILAYNLFSEEVKEGAPLKRMDYTCIPQVVFSVPEVASVGLTERDARAKYGDAAVLSGRFPYASTAKGYALGYGEESVDRAFVKLVTEKKSGKILGVHIIGAQASLLMQYYSYLMNLSPHEIPATDPELRASEALLAARTLPLSPSPDPGQLHCMDELVTAHPSLAEVAAWANGALEEAAEC